MHSAHFKIGSTHYSIHYNSDWSGDVIITEVRPRNESETRMPGKLFQVAAHIILNQAAHEEIEALGDRIFDKLKLDYQG